MYNEELEGFEEAEERPRTFVTNFSQQDAEKLARENEKLKKNLEKEKFFNKLLDQELKEAKADASGRLPAEFQHGRRGASAGAFYTVLFLALAMAGFIAYTLYYNKQYDLFQKTTAVSEPVNVPTTPTEPQTEQNNDFSSPAPKELKPEPEAPKPTVKETPPVVSNQNTKPATKKPTVTQQNPTPPPPRGEETAEDETTDPAATESTTPAEPVQRPVIGHYRVSSKANFYNAPDENTLRSTYISAGNNKTVNALDDKNGFIYVEYTNELGLVSRGWLSKTDLTRID